METKKHITKSFSVPVTDAESCFALGKLERHCERTGKRFNFMVMQAIKLYIREKDIDDGFKDFERNRSKNV